MTVEAAIYALMMASSEISGAADDRIYPLVAPDCVATPYITYQRISGERWNSLAGSVGKAQPRIQIDVWAETYAAAKQLGDAIRRALDGYRGTVGGIRIGALRIESDQDFFENDPVPALYRVSMDFRVTHAEARA